ncbi:arginine--tRNA ligase [Aquisalimonas lutea]|uniref:arginine--tRNA ligase n=1 Tax=Aquisalimonas lutea TaxID=1327750 RepID=UPI0025B5EFC3|nr:arginine--tRNA ligase [Aquisalimonas lutea]MDN3516757.1 arginine--tRNA ligase [Aquisalimonas lutea]
MKEKLRSLVARAVDQLGRDGTLPADTQVEIQVERARDKGHGDYAVNTAMVLAKQAGMKPRELAERLVAALPDDPGVAGITIAGPGFINFEITQEAAYAAVRDALAEGAAYGRSKLGAGQRINLEFVSANPTGPLHVGHGRGAAFGGALASLLAAAGYDVHREYYVNDAGRQMDILATSVWLRYLEHQGESLRLPDNAYRGDYVRGIARKLAGEKGDTLLQPAEVVMAELPLDGSEGGDKEEYIDTLVTRCKTLLGPEAFAGVFQLALDTVLEDIRDDLAAFGVTYDEWFSERSLTDTGAVERALERLDEAGHLYEADGAVWFRSSAFGDEKDRVVRRDNGATTYFASDIAYHLDKLERGYGHCIDVWGADHHGYVPRVHAALRALDRDPEQLDIRLVQFAILYRGSERMPMSTRSGQFVTLRELREDVGADAARFFYVMRKPEQHLDFDLELAKSESSDNPVYYIQYAHARICSVLVQMREKGLSHDPDNGDRHLTRLTESHETELVSAIGRYPELIELAARAREPHQLAHYLRELASHVHTYYNAHQFLVEDPDLRDARLNLVLAARQVIRNGLGLLGVSAPEAM